MSTTTRSIGDRSHYTRFQLWGAIASIVFGAGLLAACGPAGGAMDADGGGVIVSDPSKATPDAASAPDAGSTPDTGTSKADAGAPDATAKPPAADGGVEMPPPNVTCTVGAQCASGFCVDGVCCDRACDGTCESCAQTGKVGTCSPLKNATDDGCSGDSTCDGSGACRKVVGKACAFASDCATGNCVDGVCCGSASCGTCQSCAVPGSAGTCTIVPKFTDDADSGCSGETTCNGLGECRSKNGTACGGDAECTSLHCTDNVCCNEACNGTCFSCNQQGSAGTCSPIDGDQDPTADVACTGSSICTARSGASPACKVKDGEACTTNADCLNGSCITSYRDGDKDGYGHDRVSRCELAPAAGYVLTGGDCCDSDPQTHPGVTAYGGVANACGGFDRNCDGKIERSDGSTATCGCITAGNLGRFCISCL